MAKTNTAPVDMTGFENFEEVKLSLDIRTLDEKNTTIRGIFKGVSIMLDIDGNPKINPKTGNEMEYATFNTTTGEEFGIWMDGGLKGALNFNRVKPGMAVRVTYTGIKKDVPTNFGLKDIKAYEIVGLQAK